MSVCIAAAGHSEGVGMAERVVAGGWGVIILLMGRKVESAAAPYR